MNRRRVVALVDGFNLYHALDDLNFEGATKVFRSHKQHLKWLDLAGLARAFIQPSREELVGTWYFSAFATWLPAPYRRHLAYVKALQATSVRVVLGNFKEKHRSCQKCKAAWIAHEEKESDVNFAIHLLQLAYDNVFDKALLLTADTDLVPAIPLVASKFSDKQLVAVIPERRFGTALELRQACHQAMRIREHHLSANLLPEQVTDAAGKVVATRPSKYSPPKP